MTRRLYYDDCYLREFRARVLEITGTKVYLDQTAFYPSSGGQPFDRGRIGAAAVIGVEDEGDRIVHEVSEPLPAGEYDCAIDWPRRFDHMQQHTGQHLLSAVFATQYGMPTLSVHLGEQASTIDLDAAEVPANLIRAAEARANEIVWENRPVSIGYARASEATELRKPSERDGLLRIVSIEGLDRSACGGTHVKAAGEIGPVLVRRLEKVRGKVRVEFLCGARALARARGDYDALTEVARVLSASLDDAPGLVAALSDRAADAEKARRKLAAELAQVRGREAARHTAPDEHGLRRTVLRRATGPPDDEVRAFAQGFTSETRSIVIVAFESPPSLLAAASGDAGFHCGQMLKRGVEAAGGRGGGSATMAQGSVPSLEALEGVLKAI
jgi:alanyl-tRNA synthetase